MSTTMITNEMLYELIKNFKDDTRQHFEQVEKRLNNIEEEQREDRKILMKLWENRSRSNLNFSSIYFLVTLFVSITLALLGSLLMTNLLR